MKKVMNNNAELLKKLTHKIRNMQPLNLTEIDNINNMSDEDKMCIIQTFNDTLKNIVESLDD